MRAARILFGFAISAVFLYFAFRGQDFNAIRDAFRQVSYWYLVPAMALYFTGLVIRSYRWSILLRPVTKATTRELVPINAVGLMANNVLPLRTGEFVRAYALSQRTTATKSASLATIAVERIFDGLTMLLFIAVSMIFVSLTNDLEHVAVLALMLFTVALVVIVILVAGGRYRDRLIAWMSRRLPTGAQPRFDRMAASFLSGLTIFRRGRDLALVAGASIVAWSFEASVYWMVAHAFGGPVAEVMGVPEALLTTGIANLATLVPSSPGYVGPFEAAVILVLSGALGVSRALALSYGILIHALLFIPVTIWGLIEWGRLHLSLRQVERLREEVDEPPRFEPQRGDAPHSIDDRNPAPSMHR
jgi:glycosyltransferase 2 family protein